MSAPNSYSLRLYSGAYFDLDLLNVEDVTILDIAHALAMTCRFGGHTPLFYSVAEHSVLASHLVPPPFALAALMHDAAEALLGDVPSPLKAMLPDYRALEARTARALARRFALPEVLPPEVHWADRAMLTLERRALFPGAGPWRGEADLSNLAEPPRFRWWTPQSARARFLARYRTLGGVE